MNTNRRVLWLLGIGLAVSSLLYRVHAATSAPDSWPPRAEIAYPDISFKDRDGKTVKMSDFRGRPIVVHYIGMTCPSCNGNAVHRRGNFENYSKGIRLEDPRFVDIDVLLFNDQMQPPTPEDAKSWAAKYPRNNPSRDLVLVAPAWTHDSEHHPTSHRMVGGTQLLDAKGIVRVSVVTEYAGQKTLKQYWPDLVATLAGWLNGSKS